MGDSENAQQPSKKRAALKELSRDNPGLVDEEEDSSAMESGTFKTASEEVLASRRIVRVKRRDPSTPAPTSNPFAGICLVPSTTAGETNKPLPISNSTPSEGKQETHDDKRSDGDKNDKSEAIDTVRKQEIHDDGRSDTIKEVLDGSEKEKSDGNEDAKEKENAKDNDNSKTDKGIDCVDKDSGGDQTEKEEKEGTDKNGDSGALSSFQQHSSSKNAFTGLASAGFSASSFSFGSGSGSLSAQSSFSFGLPNNGNSSLFNTSGSTSITTNTAGTATAFPSKQEVTVKTGEENEKATFTADSVMFEYIEGGWKERGKGEVKLNISTSNSNKARLVMRSKGNYRLILNASLYPEMKLASMDKKGITFVCVNSISETRNGLSTLALKFKDPTVVEEFRAVIEEHKQPKTTVVEAVAPPLKTPENSPES